MVVKLNVCAARKKSRIQNRKTEKGDGEKTAQVKSPSMRSGAITCAVCRERKKGSLLFCSLMRLSKRTLCVYVRTKMFVQPR